MATVKKVSFGNTGGVGGEAAMEAARRQQMADMLRQQSMEPMKQQMVSGHVVQNSPWEGLTKLGIAWLANRNQKKADAASSEASTAMAAQQAEALRSMAPDGELTPEWKQAIAAYQNDPELGRKLIEGLRKPEDFSTTPQYDQEGNAFVLGNRNTKRMIQGVKARDKMEAVNGVAMNMYDAKPGQILPQDPNKPFMQGQGGPVANAPYQQYEMEKTRIGQPKIDITTKIDNKAAESIASQVGPILKDSQIAAQGAQSQIDAANRVISAVDTNKLFAGPLASKRMAIAQFGDVIGVGGEDNSQKIANTRQAIRGLAELTLQGRKSMRGEGAITESEGKLAEKAMSGDIDSMTPAELKQIAMSSQRAARYIVTEHGRKVQKAQQTPSTAGIAGYFDVPQIAQPQAQQPAQGNQRLRRYNPATGRIE